MQPQLYAALHHTRPFIGSHQDIDEVAYAGYERVPVELVEVDNALVPSGDIQFPECMSIFKFIGGKTEAVYFSFAEADGMIKHVGPIWPLIEIKRGTIPELKLFQAPEANYPGAHGHQ